MVNKAEEYRYSSAADYVFGKQVGKVNVALLRQCADNVQLIFRFFLRFCEAGLFGEQHLTLSTRSGFAKTSHNPAAEHLGQ